jgi:hypothetical protein
VILPISTSWVARITDMNHWAHLFLAFWARSIKCRSIKVHSLVHVSYSSIQCFLKKYACSPKKPWKHWKINVNLRKLIRM